LINTAELKDILTKYYLLRKNSHLVVDFPSDKHWKFVQQPHPYKVFLGGNRSGKTETIAIEVVWHLLGEHPFYEVPKPPVRWRIHVPDYHQIDVIIEEKLKRYVPLDALRGGSWDTAVNHRTHTIRFANGSLVDFTTHRTSDKALESVSLNGVWIDEECPQKQFRSLLYRTIDKSGKVFVSATPINGITWIYEEIVRRWEEGNPNYYVDFISTYENKFLSKEDIQRIEATASEEEKDIRLHGKIMNLTKRVFNAFEPKLHVAEFSFPPVGCYFYAGLDWGFYHPTAIVFVAKYEDMFLVLDEYKSKNLRLEAVGDIIENYFSENGVNPRRVRVVYDSAMNRILPDGRKEIDLLRPFPFRLIPSAKNTMLTIATVNDLFKQNRILIHPRCKELINDLQTLYFYSGKIKEEDPAKDMCDAFRYVMFYVGSLESNYQDEFVEDEEPLFPSAEAKLREKIMAHKIRVAYGRRLY
jgi:phage terminase large subunit